MEHGARAAPLICPNCRKSDTRVVDSRDDDSVVRRRRECMDPACRHRFTTYERIETQRVYVVKRDGRREQYSREKLLTGLRKACEKRPISETTLEAATAEIEREHFARGDSEISSVAIGERVMDRLRELDQVAYIRFASVYRNFRDAESFTKEVAALRAK